MTRYAAIDIGTVTCRMLVADVDQGDLHELCREYAVTNLGEGVDATGMLTRDAMLRVDAQLKVYLDELHEFEPADGSGITVIANATSAARDAHNSAEFTSMLAARGIMLAVIPGEEEARLSFLGASRAFVGEHVLVADIGGGSTELVAGVGAGSPLYAHSHNIGCRRVTERFLKSDPPHGEELACADAWIREGLQTSFTAIKDADIDISRIVAVAGTATSVVSILKKMAVYDRAQVDGARVNREDLEHVYQTCIKMTAAEREHIVGLDPRRAPVFVAGLLILRALLDLAGAAEYTASESDILEGIILHAAGLEAS